MSAFDNGIECAGTGHSGRLAPRRVDRIESRRRGGASQASPRPAFVREESHVNIPESFILIGIVTAIPVAGIVAALIAARVPANRPDS